MVPLERMAALVGRRFPGGSYTIGHWENFLVHDALASSCDGSGLAHPAMLFHVPIAGVGVTIAEVFAMCEAESDEAVRAGAYVWEIARPLREEVEYRMDGVIVAVERKEGRRGGLMDVVTFRVDVMDAATDQVDASVTNTWVFLRRDA